MSTCENESTNPHSKDPSLTFKLFKRIRVKKSRYFAMFRPLIAANRQAKRKECCKFGIEGFVIISLIEQFFTGIVIGGLFMYDRLQIVLLLLINIVVIVLLVATRARVLLVFLILQVLEKIIVCLYLLLILLWPLSEVCDNSYLEDVTTYLIIAQVICSTLGGITRLLQPIVWRLSQKKCTRSISPPIDKTHEGPKTRKVYPVSSKNMEKGNRKGIVEDHSVTKVRKIPQSTRENGFEKLRKVYGKVSKIIVLSKISKRSSRRSGDVMKPKRLKTHQRRLSRKGTELELEDFS